MVETRLKGAKEQESDEKKNEIKDGFASDVCEVEKKHSIVRI